MESSALEAQRAKHPELAEQLDNLVKFADAKLYHQLTVAVFKYLENPPFAVATPELAAELVAFFEGFLKPFEAKLDNVKYVQLLAIVCRPQEPAKALELLTPLEEKVSKHRDAKYLWQALMAEKQTMCGKYEAAKDLLESLGEQIDNAYDVDAAIQSNFHKSYALLHKHLSKPHAYFKSSLLYLAFTPLAAIPEETRAKLAFDIGVSALVAEEEFDFGELLQQELLKSLDGSPYAWIMDLLKAFGEGRFDMYDEAFTKNRAHIDATPELKAAEKDVLRWKMSALALIEMVFRKPKKQRRMTFEEVASHCRIELKEVEHLIMKTMCEKLIVGKIDEVASLVVVTWVKPRILDNTRIDVMRERMDAWAAQTGMLLDHLEEMTPELLVS